MSAWPRRVVPRPGVTVTNDGGRTSWFVRAGSVVDILPGSALETAYGAGNLPAVITGPSRSPEAAAK